MPHAGSRSVTVLSRLVVASLVAAVVVSVGAEPALGAGTGADVVVPRVSSWTATTGTWTLAGSTRIVVDQATASSTSTGPDGPAVIGRSLEQTAGEFAIDLQSVTGHSADVVVGATPGTGDIFLVLSNADPSHGDEGYTVDVGGVLTVTAATATGIHRGTRSVLQMLTVDAGNDEIQAGTIEDTPSLSHRVISIDVGRRYWEISAIEDLIRRMSWLKLNFLQIHFNESEAFRLYSPDYAGIAPTDATQRYSQTQIAALEQFAHDHHVVLVPEIDLPAHATAVALGGGEDRSLQSECGSQYAWVLDYIDGTTRQWALNLVDEFLPWFSGPYFHIGNDEVPHDLANCPYVQDAINNDSTIDDFEALQERFANEEAARVEATGKTALMWANASNVLPDTGIVLVNFGSDANAQNLRDLGYSVINTAYDTGSYTRFFLIPAALDDARHVDRGTIYNWTPSTPGGRNLGQQIAVWADDLYYGQDVHFEQEIVGRDAELAERTWNATDTTVDHATFQARVDAVGAGPGVDTSPPPRTGDSLPEHHYTFESGHQASSDTHFPAAMTNVTIAEDVAGGLHASQRTGTAPSLGAAGVHGEAASFDLHATDRLSVGGPDLPPPWTIATWIQRRSEGTNTDLMRSWLGAIKVEQNNSSARVGITEYGVADWAFDHSVPLGQWTHLALVAEPGSTTLYLDGTAVETMSQAIDLPQGVIGGNRTFDGLLDELRLYDAALSASDIAALAADGPVTDVALGQPTTASSVETVDFPPEDATDGDSLTRWSSERSDPQWLQVDLGTTHSLTGVRLNWEAAYATDYEIQVSDDGQTWTTLVAVTGGDGGLDEHDVSGSGRYVRMYGTQRGTVYGYSLWDFEVHGTPVDLALGQPTTASSVETVDFPPEDATDGDSSTRWSSERSDPQWLQVDLGTTRSLTGVRLNWEAAYATDYEIQVSDDGQTWTTLVAVTGGDGGLDQHDISGSGRYVRMYGTQRGTVYGYSLWDFEVHGAD